MSDKFIRKTVAISINPDDPHDFELLPYGFKDAEEFIDQLDILHKELDFSRWSKAMRDDEANENIDGFLKTQTPGYELRTRTLCKMVNEMGIIEAWVTKCLDCKYGETCLFHASKVIGNESRDKTDAILGELRDAPRKDIMGDIAIIKERYGLSDERIITVINTVMKNVCGNLLHCKDTIKAKGINDINKHVFGVCSECPHRLSAAMALGKGLIGDDFDLLIRTLEDSEPGDFVGMMEWFE